MQIKLTMTIQLMLNSPPVLAPLAPSPPLRSQVAKQESARVNSQNAHVSDYWAIRTTQTGGCQQTETQSKQCGPPVGVVKLDDLLLAQANERFLIYRNGGWLLVIDYNALPCASLWRSSCINKLIPSVHN